MGAKHYKLVRQSYGVVAISRRRAPTCFCVRVFKSKEKKGMKMIADVVMNRITDGGTPVTPEYDVHAINEDGVLMEDMIMCTVLGINEIPRGFHVKHRNGNTLDNRRSNLELAND